jgi:hypothetical protein
MHLEGPWLSTTGKRKGKQKFASAEHARKAREQEESWKELQKRWGVEADEKKRKRALTAEPLATTPGAYIRDTGPRHPSLNSGLAVATLAPAKVYTGTKVKGIAQMAKSNAIPVFNTDHIIEIARMRR